MTITRYQINQVIQSVTMSDMVSQWQQCDRTTRSPKIYLKLWDNLSLEV